MAGDRAGYGAAVIVTAHQPNLLPGRSVIQKIAASDAVIWLDGVQFTKGGYVNRNRMPDGSWLTVPVERHTDGLEIRKVRIAQGHHWREKAARTLHQQYHGAFDETVGAAILRPYRLLVTLNVHLLRFVCESLCPETEWHFQSHLDAGHAVQAVSDDAEALLPISERLAMMVAEIGGEVYLSGPSGRRYLDEQPFSERGLEVEYWHHEGENPCCLGLMCPSSILTPRTSSKASALP